MTNLPPQIDRQNLVLWFRDNIYKNIHGELRREGAFAAADALIASGLLTTAPAPVTLTDIHIAIWDALCPGMIPSAEDLVHYGQAADAIMALLQRKSPAPPTATPVTQGERPRKPNFDIGSEARGDG